MIGKKLFGGSGLPTRAGPRWHERTGTEDLHLKRCVDNILLDS